MHRPGDEIPGSVVSHLDAAVQYTPVPTLVTDRLGRLLTANRAWADLTGIDPDPGRGDVWRAQLTEGDRNRLSGALAQLTGAGPGDAGPLPLVSSVELQMELPAGRRWTRWWMTPRDLGPTAVVVMTVLDVHEDMAQKADLHQLATHDDLTGLVNRRFFVETLEHALRRAERFPEPTCVLYVDLDGFKAVNDQAGHSTGDGVLRAIAGRLRQAVRAADLVARIGGDEFAVLVERLHSVDDGEVVVKRVQEALHGSVDVGGREWHLSASIGLAFARAGKETAGELLARADEAMYAVKRTRGPGRPEQGPAGREEIAAVDLRTLQDGMETLRRSLETLIRDLQLDLESPG